MDSLLPVGKPACGILSWWQSKRLEIGLIPGRQHFLPEEFKSFLSHVFIIDVEPGPQFRFRVHGTYLVDLVRRDFTGKLIGPELFGPGWRDIFDRYQRTVSARSPSVTRQMVSYPSGYDQEIEVVHLPLAKNGVDIDMVIGTVEKMGIEHEKVSRFGENAPVDWTLRSANKLGSVD